MRREGEEEEEEGGGGRSLLTIWVTSCSGVQCMNLQLLPNLQPCVMKCLQMRDILDSIPVWDRKGEIKTNYLCPLSIWHKQDSCGCHGSQKC